MRYRRKDLFDDAWLRVKMIAITISTITLGFCRLSVGSPSNWNSFDSTGALLIIPPGQQQGRGLF